MIGVAVANHLGPAFLANKIFFIFFEHIFILGAGYGNRTRISCLGSTYSTTKLIPRRFLFFKDFPPPARRGARGRHAFGLDQIYYLLAFSNDRQIPPHFFLDTSLGI